MYTPSQVSQMLSVPPSTLRRHAALFAEHLSASAHNRKRTYTEQDINTLARIRDLSAQGVPISDISARLGVLPEPTQEEPGQPDSALMLIPTLAAELELAQNTARQALTALTELREELTQSRTEQAELTARLERLERFVAVPWYRRLFNKPPK